MIGPVLAAALAAATMQNPASQEPFPKNITTDAGWKISSPGGWARSVPWYGACTMFLRFGGGDDGKGSARLLVARWKNGEVYFDYSTDDWSVTDGEEGKLLLAFDQEPGKEVRIDMTFPANGNKIPQSTTSSVRGLVPDGEKFLSRLETSSLLLLSFDHGSGRMGALSLPGMAHAVAELRRCSQTRSWTRTSR